MSKKIARGPQSIENEKLLLTLIPELLQHKGFASVTIARVGGMKFIDAKRADGSPVRFWLKQGWTNLRPYSAIQFGLFDQPKAASFDDQHFIDYVEARVASAKERGAVHALLVRMTGEQITNYVSLQIDDVAEAYRRQIAKWPKQARNTKSPTLWFEDSRGGPQADCITAVTELELPLAAVCGLSPWVKGPVVGMKKVTAEIELRMQQRAFRFRVGNRCQWRCVVSGTAIESVLDAAHLPGKNWRQNNQAEDGILIRTDLHRLLDRGLALLKDGRFWLDPSVRGGDYAEYHDRLLPT
jgi:hypothetical protein